ncbi:Serine/threonine-protein phosphatase CPPED1 [Trichoplax sp. H2]|nr:Serine/threonine-protein phosphatase CPPED1 [Trichoplax sp. H2]|eukprot:RDD38865.1 Serine/threonine-protein phosphatase CPPED1 [Trichoplax sp. H2]
MANLAKACNHTIDNSILDQQQEAKWSQPFYFIFGADPQLGIVTQDVTWQDEIQYVQRAVDEVNKMQPPPRFFMVGGDLVNSPPSKPTHRQQVEDFKKAFAQLNHQIPLMCLPGNHDIGDTPTPDDIATYRQDFGDDWYSFWCGGVYFIVLNSQYYYDGSNLQDIKKEQHQWLEDHLVEAQLAHAKHIVLFQHIPLCLQGIDEEDTYFIIPKKERLPLFSALKYHGVVSVFTGHRHANADVNVDGIQLTTASSMSFQLGNEKNGITVVKVDDKAITSKYYQYDDLPTKITFD